MPDGRADSEALADADRWLALIDRGDAEASWAAAARLLQAAVDEDTWTAALRRTQRMLGRPVARSVESLRYTTELPGAPAGEYVVIDYATTFACNESGLEQVVMTKEANGEWRAAGYHVR